MPDRARCRPAGCGGGAADVPNDASASSRCRLPAPVAEWRAAVRPVKRSSLPVQNCEGAGNVKRQDYEAPETPIDGEPDAGAARIEPPEAGLVSQASAVRTIVSRSECCGLPAEQLAPRERGSATSSGGRRPGGQPRRAWVAGHPLHRRDDLAHGIAAAGAEVERQLAAASSRPGPDMRVGEVRHMDVVADRRCRPRSGSRCRRLEPACRGRARRRSASGIRWVSGSWSSPISPSGSAPAALK